MIIVMHKDNDKYNKWLSKGLGKGSHSPTILHLKEKGQVEISMKIWGEEAIANKS